MRLRLLLILCLAGCATPPIVPACAPCAPPPTPPPLPIVAPVVPSVYAGRYVLRVVRRPLFRAPSVQTTFFDTWQDCLAAMRFCYDAAEFSCGAAEEDTADDD